MKEEAVEIINEALFEHMVPRFNAAGIPMIKFNIYESNSKDSTFDITPLFMESEEIFIKVRVIEKSGGQQDIAMVLTSGSVETIASDNKEEIFSLFASEIFKKIAKDASKMKHRTTGNSCDVNHLRKIDSGELISVALVSYIDFENLDLSGVDWSEIYCI